MSYRIPAGPYHMAVEEPHKIEVECEGEREACRAIRRFFQPRYSSLPGLYWFDVDGNERICLSPDLELRSNRSLGTGFDSATHGTKLAAPISAKPASKHQSCFTAGECHRRIEPSDPRAG